MSDATHTPTVRDGKLLRTSASAIKTFRDLERPTGCPRKWGFRYISGISAPKTIAQQKGIYGHERIEHFARTGELILTTTELAGKEWLPRDEDRSRSVFEAGPRIDDPSPFTMAGIPLAGKLDWLNATGQYVDTQRVRQTSYAPEVVDWKFSGAKDPEQWAVPPARMGDQLPMAIYGLWATRNASDMIGVRLSHVTFSTRRPRAFKRTAVVDKARLRATIDRYLPVVDEMKIAAGASDPNDLEPNLDACPAFGGCFYATDDCRRSITSKLRILMGDDPKKENELTTNTDPLAQLGIGTNTVTARASELAAALPPDPVSAAAQEVKAIWTRLTGFGVGRPVVTGDAAKLVATYATGVEYRAGASYAGTGKLGDAGITVSTLDELRQLADDLAARLAAPATMPPQAQPAPVQPAVPAMPTMVAPESQPPAQLAEPIPPEVLLTLPPSIQEAAAAHVAPETETVPESTPTAPKRKRGRPKMGDTIKAQAAEIEALKAQIASGQGTPTGDPSLQAKLDEQAAALRDAQSDHDAAIEELGKVRAQLEQARQAGDVPATDDAPRIELWVNCMPASGTVEALQPQVDALYAQIAASVKAPHVLASEHDALTFGKWRGIVASMLAQEQHRPAPGCYYLRVTEDLGGAYVSGLAPHCVMHRGS